MRVVCELVTVCVYLRETLQHGEKVGCRDLGSEGRVGEDRLWERGSSTL